MICATLVNTQTDRDKQLFTVILLAQPVELNISFMGGENGTIGRICARQNVSTLSVSLFADYRD